MKQIKSYLFLVLSGLFAAGCAMDEIVLTSSLFCAII